MELETLTFVLMFLSCQVCFVEKFDEFVCDTNYVKLLVRCGNVDWVLGTKPADWSFIIELEKRIFKDTIFICFRKLSSILPNS